MDTIIQNTQWLLPTTVISNGAVTGNQWSDPNNLLLVDGDVAQSNPGSVASDIIVGNYNVNLPQNAVVTGIQLQIIGYRGAQTSPVITLTPIAVDDTSGVDQYYPYVTPFTGLTPDLETYILGSPTYLFATSWTPDMINNFKLQLIANGDIYIDSVLLQVFYYIPDEPTPPIPDTGTCVDCSSPVQLPTLYLALPFKSGDRYAYLQAMNYADGTPFNFTDLGSCGGSIWWVFDPTLVNTGNSNFAENAITTGNVFTTLPNGTVQVDFGEQTDMSTSRGLQFHTPFAADPNLRSDHDSQAEVVISDSAPYLGQLVRQCQIGQLVSSPIEVDQSDMLILNPTVKFNFIGAGVTAAADLSDPTKVNITIPGSGGATPPPVVATTSATSGSSKVSSLSAVIEISGLDRTATVNIATQQSATISAVTVGGVAATRAIAATDTPNDLRAEEWVCVNPPLGTQTVVVTLSALAWISFGAEALAQSDTSSPVGATQSATGTSSAPTLSFTSTRDFSTILDCLCTAQTPILYTPGAGQGLNWSQTANADTRQGGSSVQQAGTEPDAITMQYSITQTTPWVYVAVEIKGISAPTPGVQSVTGLNTDETDPHNPIVKVSVDGSSVTGKGTPGDPLVAHATSLNPASIQLAVNQVAHGLSQGNLIKSNGTDNEYAKAKGDTAIDAEVVGIVVTVVDADNFVYSQDIMGYTGSGVPSGTPGEGVFLDQATAGAMTLTPDTSTTGLIVKAVGVLTAGSGAKMNFSSSYLGLINP